MPLPDYAKTLTGTAKTIRSSGGDASINLLSLANGNGTSAGAAQAATLDLGATWAQRWRVDTEFVFATAPTANNAVMLFGSFQNGNGAGLGNTTGTSAAYTGYNNDIDIATNHLEFIGSHPCVASATPTIQKSQSAIMFPKGRYLNLVVNNKSGAAFASDVSNVLIRFTPLEEGVQEDVA